MSAVHEFKKRWTDVRTSYNWNWFESFMYALNGWLLFLWYLAWAVLGWYLFDIIRFFQELK